MEGTEQRQNLVSIIMPVFNRIKLLDESIHSILCQTYSNWELIIVDDGSVDGSYEKAVNYAEADKRIKIFKRVTEPKGAPNCRNTGFKNCTGQYVIFLDSDDLLAPYCLDKRLENFNQNNDFNFLVFPILLFQKDLKDLNKLWNIDDDKENDFLRFLRGDALWQTMGPIYKKDFLAKFQPIFDTNLDYWQDYDLHLRFILDSFRYKKFLKLEPDCFHRIHYSSISHSGTFTLKMLKSRNLVIKKTWELLKIKSLNSIQAKKNLKGNLIFNVLDKSIQNKNYFFTYRVLNYYVWAGLLSLKEVFQFNILICFTLFNFSSNNYKSLVSFFFKSYWIESKIGAITR